MTIQKFTGATKEEAIAAAKEALGEHIVIMNTRDRKPEGVLGIFKKGIWEVTAAVEEDDFKLDASALKPVSPISPVNTAIPPASPTVAATPSTPKPAAPIMPGTSTFTAVADEKIDISGAIKEISAIVQKDIKESPQRPVAPQKPAEVINKDEYVAKAKSAESEKPAPKKSTAKRLNENLPLIRMLYNTLVNNEVDERYVNDILDDMGNVFTQATSLDYLIQNIYQKMVLKLGKVSPIELPEQGPLVVFFVGPTGVGKTTTIAKIASEFVLKKKKNVAFITADTYRIAAAEQLSVYAGYLNIPVNVIVDPSELNEAIEGFRGYDLILVDTLGFSHKNEEHKSLIKRLISTTDEKYAKKVYLVTSVTTKYQDLKDIVDAYKEITDYSLIFTKLDETSSHGNIFNIKQYTGAELSYITNGQSVPDDIDLLNSQKLVKSLMKGK